MLSPRSLALLSQLFNEQSNVTFPAAVARQIIEIEEWVKEQIAQLPQPNANEIRKAKPGPKPKNADVE